ncbi:GDSL-like Lipase/Acylhydrolase [Pirellulimonas nuda]|uniref:GDSL-like Lipase/Acylhydrolase n=1 Tax=Pirellulimonas nuda TaxID=2528009 RepID=A0A518DEZ6_9BACT|nr:SGNH/GDSL hydrolase family protein [Pirellulimonas nuda]QDU90043.1 GDSL-like Lipase/Acylhydrolase [Pirellulimonas nuda]
MHLASTPRTALAIWTIGVGLALPTRAEQAKPYDPSRWEDAISAIEARDQKSPPPQRGIVFVGSSSVRLWPVATSFPDRRVVNHGFGGSQICDSNHFFDRLVAPLKPHTVVFYAGDNDIAAGKSPAQVHSDFQAFVAKLHEALPETRLVYVAIKPSLARWKLADTIREANGLIREDAEGDELVSYLDVWPPMLGADGTPRKELFREDGLHLNDEGYRVWTKLLRQSLADRQSATPR